MEDITTLNPHLAPLKNEAEAVIREIEAFEKTRGISPVYIRFPRTAWQRSMSHYCGLIVVVDPTVSWFALDV